jgi:exonuclease SbcD
MHVSDTHLGIFPREYGKIDPSTGLRVRTQDFTNSFLFVTEFALKEHVDAILMCGDVFDRIDPPNRVRKDVLDSLMRVTQHGVKVIIIGGNHDTPRLLGSASPLQLLEHIGGVHVFHKPSNEPFTLKATAGSDDVDVYQFPYLPPARWFDFAKSESVLRVSEGELTLSDRHGMIVGCIKKTLDDMGNVARSRKNSRSILMMHYMIEGSDVGHTAYIINDIVIPRGIIPFNIFNYVACGHVHKHQSVTPHGQEGSAYFSGSTERTSFNERDEEKGFILLDTSGASEFTTEFVKVPTRPMQLIEIKASESTAGGSDIKADVMKLLNVLQQTKERREEKEAIVRILIRNATPELKTSISLKEDAIQVLLRNAFHWEIDYEARKDEIHPSLKAGEIFLSPTQELTRYVEAMKSIGDDEKKHIVKLGEQVLEEIIGKPGETE